MLGNLTGWHLVLVLAIVLLLFGAPKLPALARSIAQSMRIFKSEVKSTDPDAIEDSLVDVDATPAIPAPAQSTQAKTKPAKAKSAQASASQASPAKAKAKKSSSGDTATKS